MTTDWRPAIPESIRNSQLLRVLLIGLLILVLQTPIAMIRGVIKERQETRNAAVQEVTAKWGKNQSLVGPWITIPYVRQWAKTRKYGNTEETEPHTETRYATFLPEILTVSGTIDSETRYRGIFQVPVYSMAVDVTGRFARPDCPRFRMDRRGERGEFQH